jgi:hypothetical protein
MANRRIAVLTLKIEFVYSSSILTQRKNEGHEGPRSVAELKY